MLTVIWTKSHTLQLSDQEKVRASVIKSPSANNGGEW